MTDPRPVHLTGTLTCTTLADGTLIARYLPDHIALSRAEPGCLRFAVTPTANPLIWQVAESFANRAAFDAHQTRTRASTWFAATRHIPRNFRVSDG